MSTHCEWCGRVYQEHPKYKETCIHCGGPKSEPKPVPQSDTFFYKDWYVVMCQDYERMGFRFRLYAGQELKDEVFISHLEIERNVLPGYDIMPYIETKLHITIPANFDPFRKVLG